MSQFHTSVLHKELLRFFDGLSLRYFVDATLGAGGHAEAFLQAHPEIELLIGIDQDPVARKIAEERLAPWKNQVQVFSGNFSNLQTYLNQLKIARVDGMIFDLGVSSMQLNFAEKGFSFMRNGPLDMRMDPSQDLKAADIINTWPESQLGYIFREYGEEKQWRRAAYIIVKARKPQPITTTFELAELLSKALPKHKKGIHPATLIFQALRIAVNNELQVLETTLPLAINLLAPGARLGVISFHSLEDRIVKNIMRFAASDKVNTSGIGGLFLDKEPIVNIVTRKPVTPSEEEMEHNPRSRSAKLRIVEKQ